jgi:hypothetical protein
MSNREGIGRVPFALSKYYCQIRREILSNLYLPGHIFLFLLTYFKTGDPVYDSFTAFVTKE